MKKNNIIPKKHRLIVKIICLFLPTIFCLNVDAQCTLIDNLNAKGAVPDPTLAYTDSNPPFGCDTETTYPSPLVTDEQSGTFASAFCNPALPPYRGLDESYQVIIGGDLIIPSTGGAEIEGRAVIGGNIQVDRNPYGISESGGGTYVVGAAGDALIVGGNISGTGVLSVGANNTGETYNVISGGTNSATLNNGTEVENTASLPVEVAGVMSEMTCISEDLKNATPTGGYDSATNFFRGSMDPALEILTVDGADLNPSTAFNSGYADIDYNATLVVNVSGTTVDINYNVRAGRVDDPTFAAFGGGPLVYNVIWNFYEATTITLHNDFHGTMIAPLADVEVIGNYNGRIYIGGDLTHSGSGSEIHNYPFTGDFTAALTANTTSTCCGADASCSIINAGLANAPSCTGTNAIAFDLNPTGSSVGATYNVSISGGAATSISPTSGTYDTTTAFTLNDNSAGGGDVTITLTDVDDPACTLDVVVTDPGTCVPTTTYDVALTKTVDLSAASIGSPVVFTIVVENLEDAITGATVNDVLPAGLTYDGVYTASTGTYDGTNWTIGDMAVGATETITITATADAEGVMTNEAVVSINETETNLTNNEDKACVSVPVQVCDNEAVNVDITAEAGLTTYQWYKDGVAIVGATNQIYNATEVGTYTYTVDGAGPTGDCEGELCCPVIIEQISCCAPINCLPITITKLN